MTFLTVSTDDFIGSEDEDESSFPAQPLPEICIVDWTGQAAGYDRSRSERLSDLCLNWRNWNQTTNISQMYIWHIYLSLACIVTSCICVISTRR